MNVGIIALRTRIYTLARWCYVARVLRHIIPSVFLSTEVRCCRLRIPVTTVWKTNARVAHEYVPLDYIFT